MERYSTLIDLILYELRFFLNVYEMLEKQPCGQSSITSNLSSIIRQDASYPSICSAFALRLYIMSTFKPRFVLVLDGRQIPHPCSGSKVKFPIPGERQGVKCPLGEGDVEVTN